MNVRITAAALLLLALTGCAAEQSSTPTDDATAACAEAIATLATSDPADFEAGDAAILEAARVCETWPEFIAQVRENPESFLFGSADSVDANAELIAYSVCSLDETTPVCVDAVKLGIIE